MRRYLFTAATLFVVATSSQPAAALPSCEMMFEPMAGDKCIYQGRVCVVTRDASVQEYVHLRCERSKEPRRPKRSPRRRSTSPPSQ